MRWIHMEAFISIQLVAIQVFNSGIGVVGGHEFIGGISFLIVTNS